MFVRNKFTLDANNSECKLQGENLMKIFMN